MERLFSVILNMSLTGTIAIGLVLLVRLALKRAPRVCAYALWAVVLFRLLCPVSLSSPASVLNLAPVPAPEAPVAAVEYVTIPNEPVSLPEAEPPERSVSFLAVAGWIWAVGVGVTAARGFREYLRLKARLAASVPVSPGVRAAEDICSPFVLGLLKPVIYIPSGMPERQQAQILLHERHHIRRGDHIWKFLSCCALCLHWFDPAVWLAFLLADRDMELSCDEAVLNMLGPQVRSDYAQSLLDLSTGVQRVTAPLAFGESETALRIRHVLGWKRGSRWALPLAAAVCAIVLAVTALNPVYEIPREEKPAPHIEELTPGYYTICDWSMDETTSGLLRIWIRLDEDGTGELRINSDRFILSWDPDSFKMEYEIWDSGDMEVECFYGGLQIHGVFREEGLSLFLAGYKLDFAYAGTEYPRSLEKPPVAPGKYAYVDHLCWTEEPKGCSLPMEEGDPELGLLKLKRDGRGTLTYNGVKRKFTWVGDSLITDDGEIQALPWMELLYDNIGYRLLKADTEPGILVKLEEEQTFLYLRRID